MAYSTRRKSVNLSLLGIHVPRPQLQRSPPTLAAAPDDDDSFQPPAKKLKLSPADTSPLLQRALASETSVPRAALPASAAHTPPASPPPAASDPQEPKYPPVDTSVIDDDVVVATIDLLEQSNNRPHMLKELAAVISSIVPVVTT
jgi:hypothetical protein